MGHSSSRTRGGRHWTSLDSSKSRAAMQGISSDARVLTLEDPFGGRCSHLHLVCVMYLPR
eukprot:6196334-Pleurochrysis_carterae.AAC.1